MKHNLITFTRCVTIAVLLGLSSGVYAESYGNTGTGVTGLLRYFGILGGSVTYTDLPEHRPLTCSDVDLQPSFATAVTKSMLSADPNHPFLLTRREFSEKGTYDSIEVSDTCAGGFGQRYLVRFSASAMNVGGTDFAIGDPFSTIPDLPNGTCSNNHPYCGLYFIFPSHNDHLHSDLYHYRVTDLSNNLVVLTKKIGIGTLDTSPLGQDSPPPKYFGAPTQDGEGISSGWADDYPYYLPCQYVDVTNLPLGKYRLEILIDVGNKVAECDETNNVASVDFEVLEKNSVNYVYDQGEKISDILFRRIAP
jgi:hypothetical protein